MVNTAAATTAAAGGRALWATRRTMGGADIWLPWPRKFRWPSSCSAASAISGVRNSTKANFFSLLSSTLTTQSPGACALARMVLKNSESSPSVVPLTLPMCSRRCGLVASAAPALAAPPLVLASAAVIFSLSAAPARSIACATMNMQS